MRFAPHRHFGKPQRFLARRDSLPDQIGESLNVLVVSEVDFDHPCARQIVRDKLRHIAPVVAPVESVVVAVSHRRNVRKFLQIVVFTHSF